MVQGLSMAVFITGVLHSEVIICIYRFTDRKRILHLYTVCVNIGILIESRHIEN